MYNKKDIIKRLLEHIKLLKNNSFRIYLQGLN